jgi:hypothetical protein
MVGLWAGGLADFMKFPAVIASSEAARQSISQHEASGLLRYAFHEYE